jgi:hypothetical protein
VTNTRIAWRRSMICPLSETNYVQASHFLY